MQFNFNDGGREQAGYKGTTGDCVTRAVAIATGRPYQEVYADINKFAETERPQKNGKTSSARTGVYKKTTRQYLLAQGFEWVPTMQIGSGCKVHLRAEELPSGTIICSVSKHIVAVIDGVIQDTFDCSRNGTRCVYGYYQKV